MLVVLWLLLTVIALLLLVLLWRWLLLLRRRRRRRRRAPLAPLAARRCCRCEQRCNGASSSFHAAAVARCALQQEGGCYNWRGGCSCLAKAQATGPSACWAVETCAALTASRNESVKKPPRVLEPRPSAFMHASPACQAKIGILARPSAPGSISIVESRYYYPQSDSCAAGSTNSRSGPLSSHAASALAS